MRRQVKRAFRYRFCPTVEQAVERSRTFGCVRLVYNKALEERTRAWWGEQRRISYVRSSATLTEWKKTDELAFLTEVSSVPLQQALRHLQTAFANFFAKRWRVAVLRGHHHPGSGHDDRRRHRRRDRARPDR